MENMLEKAVALAVEAHKGQLDKSGQTYILHPLRLMLQMDSEAEMITAVLHDVVEDSPWELEHLREMGFSDEVLEALALLTHDTAALSYDNYIQRIKGNPLARRVKLADLSHNLDIRRLPAPLSMKDMGRLAKYRGAWESLR